MSLGVLTNTAAIYAENNLNKTQSSLQNTLTQLSSGSRINSGSDDAAGLSVVSGLQANVSALTQSSQNAADGIGLLQTADGALSQVTNLLNRAVTLATESANGTLNANQVSSANAEYQNILTEIGNIGSTTNFNGNSVFTAAAKTVFVSDGTSSGATSFSETVGTLSAAGVGVSAPSAGTTANTAITNPTPTASTASAGATATFTVGATTDTLSGTLSITNPAVASGAAVTSTLAAGTTLAAAVTQLNAQYGSNGLVASESSNHLSLVITGPADTGTAGTNAITLTGTALQQGVTTGATTVPGAGTDFTAAGVSTLTAASAATGADHGHYRDRQCGVSARHYRGGRERAFGRVDRRIGGVGESDLGAKQHPVHRLRRGDQQSGEVPGTQPDRHQRSGTGEQRAAGSAEAAPIRRRLRVRNAAEPSRARGAGP